MCELVYRIIGIGLAWRMRNQAKADFLAGNRSQKGQSLLTERHMLFTLVPWFFTNTNYLVALPLALNFIAAGE